MATVEQCQQALTTLAERLAARPAVAGQLDADRSLSCSCPDLGVVFTGRLHRGRLDDIAPAQNAEAQIRIEVSSDDLVALVDGSLPAAKAWASGRLKVRAGIADMLRLRTLF